MLGAELLEGASFGSNHASKTPQMVPEEMEVVSGEAIMSARTVRKRRIAGIFQHYYPEGNFSFSIRNEEFKVEFIKKNPCVFL